MPDFEHLTLTAMIKRAAEEVAACPPGPVYLIGSSMGGVVALHLQDRVAEAALRVEKTVLLAPALDFIANRQRALGEDGLQRWRDSGWLTVRHFADDVDRQLHYDLVRDVAKYESFRVTVHTPILLIHGKQDESVDYTQSVRFAQIRPNVQLHLIDADHALTDVLPEITTMIMQFFDLKAQS